MLSIPSAAEPILMSFSIAFTQPTLQRILALTIGAILTIGRGTLTAVLWTMRGLLSGHPSTYPWSSLVQYGPCGLWAEFWPA